ncbi:NAD(P)-dependent dehydrogenase (short-subunit alcohol dehydrogenase family) [Paenibacillus endophyticus]|uniref:NAD(P)-dependent dehydrogenase (Short-subunit alcohol dehydrogenase family) n=1 Tax=Paenibacillus endophyticus TaxID=1294268 RepID=A0A7W5C4Y3_9BACL|nr:SDR family NAD(P)-dependent oxidoreductase [Paenibacillus endophyticus]MBB3151248.1 NAD(P)-dependent dehydrogenase (short-subunit alcohol dehydrogenase family) [Paenibacillus endophyticus]
MTESKQSSGRLRGKTALITGAGSGIGRAAALQFAKEGADLVLLDVKEKAMEEVCRSIQRYDVECLAIETDISSEIQLANAYRQVRERFDSLDIVYANAGINGTLAPIELMDFDDWNTTLQVNLSGTFLTVKHAIPFMKNNGGSIIITSSINGNRVFSNIGFSAYSSTKAGQVAFAKMAALELAQYKIRVNVICPGAIDTNIEENTERTPELDQVIIPVEYPEGSQPLEDGPGSAAQVAKLALFLASDDSNHISGTDIYIDGAESLLRG